jgi:hypothetical protein
LQPFGGDECGYDENINIDQPSNPNEPLCEEEEQHEILFIEWVPLVLRLLLF